jgi:hypothetical protein
MGIPSAVAAHTFYRNDDPRQDVWSETGDLLALFRWDSNDQILARGPAMIEVSAGYTPKGTRRRAKVRFRSSPAEREPDWIRKIERYGYR